MLREDVEPHLLRSAERGQVRMNEESIGHVEVFQTGSVRASILGTARRLPRHRLAGPGALRRSTLI